MGNIWLNGLAVPSTQHCAFIIISVPHYNTLHTFLWTFQASCWCSRLQYATFLHRAHCLRFRVTSQPSRPQNRIMFEKTPFVTNDAAGAALTRALAAPSSSFCFPLASWKGSVGRLWYFLGCLPPPLQSQPLLPPPYLSSSAQAA